MDYNARDFGRLDQGTTPFMTSDLVEDVEESYDGV